MTARQLVIRFENEIWGLLTDQQKAEACGEEWKRTVIAIRDAYLRSGLSEEEALSDAELLWVSTRYGVDVSARVIDKIRRRMLVVPA